MPLPGSANSGRLATISGIAQPDPGRSINLVSHAKYSSVKSYPKSKTMLILRAVYLLSKLIV